MKTTCYLQVRPDYSPWSNRVASVAVVRVTQGKPSTLKDGCVVVKAVLDVPEGLFSPPEIVVNIPVPDVETSPPVTATLVELEPVEESVS